MTVHAPFCRCAAARLLLLLALIVGLTAAWSCRSSTGVPDAPQAEDSARTVPLRVLVVDDPALASAVRREWLARSAGAIDLQETTADELLASRSTRLGADVIIYPSGLIGELAGREWLEPIDPNQLDDPQLARKDLLPLQRLSEVAWGEKVLAVPFGSPQLTVWYRRDILERLGAAPPGSWPEYLALAHRLSADRRDAAAPDAWYPLAEPLGDGWAGQVLLARAAAYARHAGQFSALFDPRTMEPLIGGPPFVRALDELVEAAKLGPPDATQLDPAALRRGFAAGRYGMVLSWPTSADVPTTATTETASSPLVAAGFAELPGSADVFNFRQNQWETRAEGEERAVTLLGIAGRLGSLTRECRRPHVGLNLLFWLSGPDLGDDVAPESPHTTLYRESHVATVSRWVDSYLDAEAGRQYAAAVHAAQSRATWLGCVRIPGRNQYLAALDEAVHQGVRGSVSASEALQAAATRWRELTNKLGREQQQAAYIRSIGLEP